MADARELFVFTASWCPQCRRMKDAGVIPKLRRQVSVPITAVDLSRGITPLAEQYGVRLIPSFVLIDLTTGGVVRRASGAKTVEQLVRFTER